MSSDALKNSVNMKPNSTISEQIRTYQVVVAATREMGIGKDGKLPWKLPSDLKFFKDVTLTTSDPGKRNAVIMGRKTWDSIPVKYRPLPGRLNVVLSRSGSSDMESFDDVVKCGSMDSALKMLAGSPYGFSVEKVFVIGGGQILREALNAPACEAIHLTEIETNIECDTFIPTISDSLFHPWYSSFPLVENGIRYAFTTFVRVKREMVDDCAALEAQNLCFLPEIIYKRHEAFTYLQLIQEVISTGIANGNWTKGIISKFGFPMRYNLRKTFPLFTTEGVLWPEIVEELLWIISGSTNANVLRDKGIHVWDKYATRSYLDSIGLQDREEGDLGPFYGFQWRHFGARYMNMHANYSGQGTDQLAEVISKIKNNPEDRRIILSSWNPSDIKAMAIPPQHMFAQFYVANGELSCLVYHRSANLLSSLPVCIASYALLTCMLAHVCDIAPGDLIHVNGNIDLQDTDIGILHEQLERSPNLFPILKIKPEKKNIESFVAADFELLGGHKNPPMKLNIKQFVLPATRSERHEEFMYLELIQDIISTGNVKGDRTGTGTVSKFGCQMCFNLRESFPLLTTKRVFWRGIVEELLWFISGSTNAKVLQEKDIHIWDGNASRSYLDSIGLGNREEGDLGPVYGFQWRHFGARYTNMHTDYTGQGIDQLAEVISKIKNRPNDTDIVLTAWNPPCLKEMALPPCHMLAHFLVVNGEVSCLMYQRSADMGLGVPFNIASYSLLTCMVAHVCDLAPGDFVHVIGDTHIYNTHLGPLQEQLKNSPKPFPVLKINPEKKNINSFVAADFELIGYLPHRKIGMKMAV